MQLCYKYSNIMDFQMIFLTIVNHNSSLSFGNIGSCFSKFHVSCLLAIIHKLMVNPNAPFKLWSNIFVVYLTINMMIGLLSYTLWSFPTTPLYIRLPHIHHFSQTLDITLIGQCWNTLNSLQFQLQKITQHKLKKLLAQYLQDAQPAHKNVANHHRLNHLLGTPRFQVGDLVWLLRRHV